MTRHLGGAFAIVCLVAGASVAADAPAVRIADFAFMAGCWQGGDAQTALEENWMRPGGGTMMGTSRVLAAGKTVFSEFVEVAEKPAGLVMTVALGIGQPGVAFTRIAAGADEVVFENPAHDFPQRIRYRKVSDTSVTARIEGVEKGQAKGEDYVFRKVPCP
jgi:Domain of unknown function (DUF6265)